MSHRFVWVDIPVTDLRRACAFYAAVIDQPVSVEGGPGFSFGVLPHADADVGGCLYVADTDNQPSRQGPLLYLNVEGRLDAALAAVSAHGGEILQPVHPIGPHGFRAIVLDSEGNRVALHSPTR